MPKNLKIWNIFNVLLYWWIINDDLLELDSTDNRRINQKYCTKLASSKCAIF